MRILTLGISSVLCTLLYAQNGINSKKIDSLVEYSMKTIPQAGLAIAVVKDGEIIHQKGYGVTSINGNQKIDENTLFGIASNSKAFTATALGMLVDQGKLNWNDKVVQHIPEFTMYDPWVTANFTITDLLTHRSGLDLGAGDLMFFPSGTDFTIDDVLKSFQYHSPTSDFRTKYDYDNLLYIVAGEVIKRVSGKPWDQFIEEDIMAKIEMTQSVGIIQNIKNNENVANPHQIRDGKVVEIKAHVESEVGFAAAGGIYSNVSEMCNWMMMHLNNGKYTEDEELISEKNHAKLWEMQTKTSFSVKGSERYNTHYSGYGLGFFLTDMKGYIVVDHTGGLPGMLSKVTMIPELNLGIVVLTNCAPGGYSFITLTNEILDEYLEVKEMDWIKWADERLSASRSESDSVINAVWEKTKSMSKTKVNKSAFIGTYEDNWLGKIEVYEKDKKLWFKSLRSEQLHGPMSYYNANTFAIDWLTEDQEFNAFAMFTLDENGKAIGIKMKGIDPHIDFSYDFQHLDFKRVD